MVLPPLATVDDYADLTGQDVTDQTAVSAALLRASSMLRAATRQTITRVVDDVLTLPWGVPLILPQRPADDPTSITSNGQPVTGWQLVGQEITNFYLPGISWGFPTVITYSHGFATVPDEITAIVVDATARSTVNPENVRQVGNVTFGAETIGGLTFTDDEIRRARRVLGVPSTVSMSVS